MTIYDCLRSTDFPNKAVLQKLLCHFLNVSKEQLYTQHETVLTEQQQQWIKDGYTAYTVDNKPLEYIVGSVEFLWVKFAVSPATLIPRPETEYMIEAINEYCQEHKESRFSLLDIWTGCWVLWLSSLLHNQDSFSQAILSDLSSEALEVAQKNHESLVKTPVTFLEASLCDHDEIRKLLWWSQETILTANLPYIPEKLFHENTDATVHDWEPAMAFLGGEDGLDLYRIMFDQILEGNHKPIQFLEMMTWQVDKLRDEYGEKLLFEEIKTFHFNIRIVRATTR